VAVAAAAAAAVVATVAASVVVAAVALLFLPKGHVACGSSRRGAHRRRAQLPNRHKAAIPKSHSSLALYTPNVKPPLYTKPPAHGSVNLQRTRCCCWQLQLPLITQYKPRLTKRKRQQKNVNPRRLNANRAITITRIVILLCHLNFINKQHTFHNDVDVKCKRKTNREPRKKKPASQKFRAH
jgi:hypothetical protein